MALGAMGTENNERGWVKLLYRWLPTPTGAFDHTCDVLVSYVFFAIVERDCVLRTIDDRGRRPGISKLPNGSARGRPASSVPRSLEARGEIRPKATHYRVRASKRCN